MRHHLFVSCRSVTACCSGAFKPTLLMMRKNHNNNKHPIPGTPQLEAGANANPHPRLTHIIPQPI